MSHDAESGDADADGRSEEFVQWPPAVVERRAGGENIVDEEYMIDNTSVSGVMQFLCAAIV